MKKTISLILALLLVIGLAACAGKTKDDSDAAKQSADESASEGETDAEKAPESAAETYPTAIGALRYDLPQNIESAERIVEQTADGEVTQFTLSFTLSDKSVVGYACAKGLDLASRGSLESLETAEVNGRTYYLVKNSGEIYGYTQYGEDVYAIECAADSEENTRALLDTTIAALRYEDETKLVPADLDLFDITYTVDKTLQLAGYNINIVTDKDGNVKEKTVMWKYGEDLSDPDFRLKICVYRNDTLENVTDEDSQYEEKTVGDITYTILHVDEYTVPYDYLVQHGDDVYEIRNSGHYTGWSTTRSTESEDAFTAFVESVRFK